MWPRWLRKKSRGRIFVEGVQDVPIGNKGPHCEFVLAQLLRHKLGRSWSKLWSGSSLNQKTRMGPRDSCIFNNGSHQVAKRLLFRLLCAFRSTHGEDTALGDPDLWAPKASQNVRKNGVDPRAILLFGQIAIGV